MKDDLKARFTAYSARGKEQPLNENMPEKMDDILER